LVPQTTVFIGSSSAARAQARVVVERFSGPTLRFLPWWDAFTPGRTLLEDLDAIGDRVDAALMLFSPETDSSVRGKTVQVPNQNVLFEFGYFYGRLGAARTAMLKYGDFYLPSDFGGYVHIFGGASFKRGAAVPIGRRTEREFTRWVEAV
jgi:predicted nucleotide-binding protein